MRTTSGLLLGMLLTAWAYADTANVKVRVLQTLVDSELYGGCMARLDVDFADVGLPGCPAQWVTFSCTGRFNDPEMGWRKLEAAQLALATETVVFAKVDDSRKHHGYCFARRIDNYYY